MRTLKECLKVSITGRQKLGWLGQKVDITTDVKQPMNYNDFLTKNEYRFELRIGAVLCLHPNDMDKGLDEAAALMCREIYRDMTPLIHKLQTAIVERDLDAMEEVADKMWNLSTRGES